MPRLSTRNVNADELILADFTGGLRLDIPVGSPLFQPNMLQKAVNAELDYTTGKLTVVDGLVPLVKLPAAADTLFYNHNDNYFLVNCGRTLYKLSGYLSPVSKAESIGQLSGIRRPEYAVYGSYTAIVSGGRVQYYGYKQPLTEVAASPASTMCHVSGGRLYVAHSNGPRISMCGANDITNWQFSSKSEDEWTEQDAWYADIAPGTGGIAAMRKLDSNIIVVKKSGESYRFTGDHPSVFHAYDGPEGVHVVGQSGLLLTAAGLFYIGRDGFNALNFAASEYGSLRSDAVGAGVNDELKRGVSQNACLWDIAPKKQVWVRADELGNTYLFHYFSGAWTVRKFSLPVSDVCLVGNTVYVLANDTIYRLDETADTEVNGNPIQVEVVGKEYRTMNEFLIKRIAVSVDAKSAVDAKVSVGKLELPIGYTSASPYIHDMTDYIHDADYPIWTLTRSTPEQKRQVYRCKSFAVRLASTRGVFALNDIQLEVVGV